MVGGENPLHLFACDDRSISLPDVGKPLRSLLHLISIFRRLQPMISNVAQILGIEFLAASQGIDFLRPLHSSPTLESVHALLRASCPAMVQDRFLAPDIELASTLVTDGSLARILRSLPGLPTLWTPA